MVVLVTGLFVAALGLLIGASAREEVQAVIFSLVPMFVLAGLGGAWLPLEVNGRRFQVIGHLTPVAWAMDGFQKILARARARFRVTPGGCPARLCYAFLWFGCLAFSV